MYFNKNVICAYGKSSHKRPRRLFNMEDSGGGGVIIKSDEVEECLVGHVPIEISSLLNHFLKDNKSSSIQGKMIVKRKRDWFACTCDTYGVQRK